MGGLSKPTSWFPSFIWVPPGFLEALVKFAPPEADCRNWNPFEKKLFKHLIEQNSWKNFKLQTWMHLQAIDDCLMDARNLLGCHLNNEQGLTLKGREQSLRQFFLVIQRIINVTNTIKRDNRVFNIFWDQTPFPLKNFLNNYKSSKPTSDLGGFAWQEKDDLVNFFPLAMTYVRHFWDFWVTYSKHLYFIFSWLQELGEEEITVFDLKNFAVWPAFWSS